MVCEVAAECGVSACDTDFVIAVITVPIRDSGSKEAAPY